MGQKDKEQKDKNENRSRHKKDSLKNRNAKRNNSRSSSRNRNRKPRSKKEKLYCASCGKPITNVSSALVSRDQKGFMHFECVVELIKQEERIVPPQKLVYIGQGDFAIVETSSKKKDFTIIKRIPYENSDMKKFAKSEMKNYLHTVEI